MISKRIEELNGHDVYEIAYEQNYDTKTGIKHWNDNSLYIEEDDFIEVICFIEKELEFNCMGPNKIRVQEWNGIKNTIIRSEKIGNRIKTLIYEIDLWLCKNNKENNYFWILGI